MESNSKIGKTAIELFVISRSKEFRISAKMSQADLAFKLNVSVGFIGKVESEKSSSKYNLNHIAQMAIIFNVSPSDFLPKSN